MKLKVSDALRTLSIEELTGNDKRSRDSSGDIASSSADTSRSCRAVFGTMDSEDKVGLCKIIKKNSIKTIRCPAWVKGIKFHSSPLFY